MALGSIVIDIILYVGKTTDLKSRLRSYVRIKEGYDTRPGISHMFSVYGERVKMLFSPCPPNTLADIENAIYHTTMPEYNLISPQSDQ